MNHKKEKKKKEQDKRKDKNVRNFISNVSTGSPGKRKGKLGFFMSVVCGILC